MVSIREARPTDVVKYAKHTSPLWFYGIIGEENGVDIAMGVLVWAASGKVYLCLDYHEEAKQHPVFMHRIAKMLTETAGKICGSVYTLEASKEPTASKWLAKLGYTPTGETLNGERVLSWHSC
jgi:hypothetical protein